MILKSVIRVPEGVPGRLKVLKKKKMNNNVSFNISFLLLYMYMLIQAFVWCILPKTWKSLKMKMVMEKTWQKVSDRDEHDEIVGK